MRWMEAKDNTALHQACSLSAADFTFYRSCISLAGPSDRKLTCCRPRELSLDSSTELRGQTPDGFLLVMGMLICFLLSFQPSVEMNPEDSLVMI